MIHTKFQGHLPSAFGEEDLFNVFPVYGHGGHLGNVTNICCKKLANLQQGVFA